MECRECKYEDESFFGPHCANCWNEATWQYRNFEPKEEKTDE